MDQIQKMSLEDDDRTSVVQFLTHPTFEVLSAASFLTTAIRPLSVVRVEAEDRLISSHLISSLSPSSVPATSSYLFFLLFLKYPPSSLYN